MTETAHGLTVRRLLLSPCRPATKGSAMSDQFPRIVATRLLEASGPLSLVLASTSANFDLARELFSSGQVDAIVGDDRNGHVSPRILLRKLEKTSALERVVIFTDQLCCSTNATILTSKGTHRQYLSGLEIVLSENHGFKMLVQVEAEFMEMKPYSTTENILFLMWTHLDQCAALGNEWLARSDQYRRDPDWRARAARRQLRLFHSSLLHMSLTRTDIDQKRAAELHHLLMEARIRCR